MQPENIKGPTDFKPKRLQFSFKAISSRFWCGNSINRSYFFNSLGTLAPSFERLFILSVLKYRKQVKGTDLEKPVKAFLGQEAQHDKQISRFNQHLLQLGYPIRALEATNLKFCKKLNSFCSPKTQLAFTMGAEHLISLLSHHHLNDPAWFKQAQPDMAALWRWHAIEEVEHKSVAFDVYHKICGQYFRKIMAYMVVIGVIAGMWVNNWFAMAKHDKMLLKPSFWFDFIIFALIRPGILLKLAWPLLKYFNPKFHPWKHDNRQLIAQWKLFFSQHPI